ncbi:hypothetical protein POZ03_01275 [Bacteroides uniformis]|uniref:hypothetical protein n=1 Tax=Bacteroides uniformis TaxID=820 RepID=UPI00233F2CB6|nr:hypothetical protein [Bacteroides uniformis]MDC1809089.1 hypothetical protein [Bacteroides uniformis]
MERNEYLQRPLIKSVIYEITDSQINISSPHTIFLSVHRDTEVPLSEVERLFRKLKKEAKDSGKVRLNGVTKFLPVIRSLYPSYHIAVERINKLFSEMVEMVPKIKNDGIHIGCVDDELLEEAKKKEEEIISFYHRKTDYSRYLEHYQNIKDILTTQRWQEENVAKIVIWLI